VDVEAIIALWPEMSRDVLLPYPEIVDALERGSADAADDGVTIAANERVGDRLGARRTVEIGHRFGHPASIRLVNWV
jgi:hypothetical protein